MRFGPRQPKEEVLLTAEASTDSLYPNPNPNPNPNPRHTGGGAGPLGHAGAAQHPAGALDVDVPAAVRQAAAGGAVGGRVRVPGEGGVLRGRVAQRGRAVGVAGGVRSYWSYARHRRHHLLPRPAWPRRPPPPVRGPCRVCRPPLQSVRLRFQWFNTMFALITPCFRSS